MEDLSKSERKELAKEQRRIETEKEKRTSIIKKYRIWLIALLVVIALGYWAYKELTRPLPGQLFEDLGREHITDISEVQYNSNPPTSGSHFAIWAKKGVYDRVLSDGYLIHSLEHGYIVINYDCTKSISSILFPIKRVYAHEDDTIPEGEPHPDSVSGDEKPLTRINFTPSANTSWITPENTPIKEVDLPENFNSDECKALVENLRPFTDKWERVVVVPRPNMEHPIALTAWRRLQWLDHFDKNAIEYFIKSYHNLGPEKTME
jgi:hypothetical protein